jgi:hypothetical protein
LCREKDMKYVAPTAARDKNPTATYCIRLFGGVSIVLAIANFSRAISKPTCLSKAQLECNLRDAPWLRFEDFPKRGVIDVAVHGVGPVELGVVEGVEGFEPKFQ